MTLLKWILKKKKELTDDEKGLLDAYDNPIDFTNKDNISEIISAVSQL